MTEEMAVLAAFARIEDSLSADLDAKNPNDRQSSRRRSSPKGRCNGPTDRSAHDLSPSA